MTCNLKPSSSEMWNAYLRIIQDKKCLIDPQNSLVKFLFSSIIQSLYNFFNEPRISNLKELSFVLSVKFVGKN